MAQEFCAEGSPMMILQPSCHHHPFVATRPDALVGNVPSCQQLFPRFLLCVLSVCVCVHVCLLCYICRGFAGLASARRSIVGWRRPVHHDIRREKGIGGDCKGKVGLCSEEWIVHCARTGGCAQFLNDITFRVSCAVWSLTNDFTRSSPIIIYHRLID